MATTGIDLDGTLQRLGYDAFRPGQREAIETLLERRRLLLVAPTGGGKSLTYQLPAAALPGTTLVVSPLIALMHDQVQALVDKDVPATFLASTLDGSEMRERLEQMVAGRFRLVYVAPERLAFPGFRASLRRLDVPLVAVDEAHCISEWGHDFRPDYMHIGDLVRDLPEAMVLACTATATPVVRDEILERLGLTADTPQRIQGFARPNLALRAREVGSKKERHRWVDSTLAEALGNPLATQQGRAPSAGNGSPGGEHSDDKTGTAIVYAPTRKETEAEAERLAGHGWLTAPYHAGFDGSRRERTHKAFSEGKLQVVVATNAFGMGIDRSDVRAVVHLAPPGSIEAYYQEVGRAGRDGEPATGLLCLSPNDMPLRRRLLELPVDGREPDPRVVQHKWGLFLELIRWAQGGSCRHDAILRYFGDEAETLDGCGRCDVCVTLEDHQDDGDVTTLVRKALSGVARLRGRFGLTAAAKLLRGADDPRLAGTGLDATPTFGCLADRAEDWVLALLRRCVAAGWVDFSSGDRPVVSLTEDGAAVMKGERPARLLLPPARRATATTGSGGTRRRTLPVESEELTPLELELFERLRAHRLEVAREENVPPYVVASDRTLRDLARIKPQSLGDLHLAHGIGPSKAKRYGDGLLRVLTESA